MPKGRKNNSVNIPLNWAQLCDKNAGAYFEIILKSLSESAFYSDETTDDLLLNIVSHKANQGYKNTSLPNISKSEMPFDLPSNWQWCRLGLITNYGTSKKAEPGELKPDTWVLDLEDIEKNTSTLIHKVRFKERNSLSTKSVFRKGDVLYSKLRPYLDKVIVADENGVCTTEILPLKCFANINPDYLKYVLKTRYFINFVNGLTKGMKMPRLGTKEGQLALFPLAPISDQNRIVSFLQDFRSNCLKTDLQYLDSEIENKIKKIHLQQISALNILSELDYQNNQLKLLGNAILLDAFKGNLVFSADEKNIEKKLRLELQSKPGQREIPILSSTVISEDIPFDIPEKWIWCYGSEVAEYVDPQPSNRTPLKSKDGIPYLAMSDINKDGTINFQSARKVSNEVLIEHKNRYILTEGDFIFGKIGTIGKPVKLPSPFCYTLSANVILIQPNRSIIDADYLFYYLGSPVAEKILRDKKSTTSYPVFGMGKARNMPIPVPSLVEQKAIVAEIERQLMIVKKIALQNSERELFVKQVLASILTTTYANNVER